MVYLPSLIIPAPGAVLLSRASKMMFPSARGSDPNNTVPETSDGVSALLHPREINNNKEQPTPKSFMHKFPNYGSLITSPPLREPIASQVAGLMEFVINRTPASARAMFTPPV